MAIQQRFSFNLHARMSYNCSKSEMAIQLIRFYFHAFNKAVWGARI